MTILGEGGCNFSLRVNISIAQPFGALLREKFQIWTEPFILPYKVDICLLFIQHILFFNLLNAY